MKRRMNLAELRKYTSLFVAAALCAVVATGCGNGGEVGEKTEAATAASASETSETHGLLAKTDENAVDPSVKVNLDDEVTDKMFNRAILNEGNLTRLAAAMKKAQNGEKVTVGVIGGSITQGSLASNPNNCYASKFFAYWSEKFPNAQLEFVNAGVGGTDSYLGVNRVDSQLLSAKPDVVIVEFSVNDGDKTMNKYSYDSLVRKILSCDSNPAVMLLFTTMEDGTSMQETHRLIGEAYDLPMISYHDVVYPEVAAGTLAWRDISPDNIHPNDKGHDIINQILRRYLNGVYDKLDTITEEPTAFADEPITRDYYKNASLYNAVNITPETSENFTTGGNPVYAQFGDNWTTEGNGSISFKVNCQTFGVFYLCTTDGKSGTYEVYIDGERKGKMEADFSGGWGNYGATKQFLIDTESAEHTIEIKAESGSEDKAFTILALMIS